QNMLAGLERRDRGRRVHVAWVADIDQINLRVFEKGLEVVVLLDSGQIHLLPRRTEVALDAAPVAGKLFAVAATDRSDAGAFQAARSEVMDHAHETNTNDPNCHHC